VRAAITACQSAPHSKASSAVDLNSPSRRLCPYLLGGRRLGHSGVQPRHKTDSQQNETDEGGNKCEDEGYRFPAARGGDEERHALLCSLESSVVSDSLSGGLSRR
jgi:hypothetical protein